VLARDGESAPALGEAEELGVLETIAIGEHDHVHCYEISKELIVRCGLHAIASAVTSCGAPSGSAEPVIAGLRTAIDSRQNRASAGSLE